MIGELIRRLLVALTEADDSDYEKAVQLAATADGAGILSDRFIPGLTLMSVDRLQLGAILKSVFELRPELFEYNRSELAKLLSALEAYQRERNGPKTEPDQKTEPNSELENDLNI